MQIQRIRRDYYAIDANGCKSGPFSCWSTPKRTGLPVRSVKKVETYTHWPLRQEEVTLRNVTWGERSTALLSAILMLF